MSSRMDVSSNARVLFVSARQAALATLCLAPISLFAVALPYKAYEHFQHGGYSADTFGHPPQHVVARL
jgi:hypothetical protein